MILADSEILKRPGLVEPLDQKYLNPSSVDVTLSSNFRFMVGFMAGIIGPIDVATNISGHTMQMERFDEGLVLHTGDFVLGATQEVINLPPDLVARVEGKSSLGRLGLAVHITAGFIDPGFSGSITLEIVNMSPRPLVLHPGMRIAQIAFTPVLGTVNRSYRQTGRYLDQPPGVPVESRYTLD